MQQTITQNFDEQLKIQMYILNQTSMSCSEAIESLKEAPYCLTVKTNGSLVLLNKSGVSDLENDIVKEANSIILDADDNYNVVSFQGLNLYNGVCFYSEKKNVTYGIPDKNELSVTLDCKPKCYLTKYLEGSTIKVFYYKHEWRMSTTNSLNAFDVYHRSKFSLGEFFEVAVSNTLNQTLETFYESLEPEMCYSYNLQVPRVNNCILEPEHTKPSITLLNSYNKNTKKMTVYINKLIASNVSDIKEILMTYNGSEKRFLNENYVLIVHEFGKIISKIVITSKYYKDLQKLIHNTISSTTIGRIVELRNSTKELLEYAHVSNDNFEKYKCFKKLYFDVVLKIYSLYVKQHIQKQQLDTDDNTCYKRILYKIHGVYINSYNSNKKIKINPNVVDNILEKCCRNDILDFMRDVNQQKYVIKQECI